VFHLGCKQEITNRRDCAGEFLLLCIISEADRAPFNHNFSDCLTLDDGTDRLSRNVSN
jgi:hypothetical protein